MIFTPPVREAPANSTPVSAPTMADGPATKPPLELRRARRRKTGRVAKAARKKNR